MNLAKFKFESFSASEREIGRQPNMNGCEIEKAFADGVTEGMARKREANMQNLKACFNDLTRSLSDDHERRARLYHEAVNALTPVLEQILDCILPIGENSRLETALANELLRLSKSMTPLHATITCNGNLRSLVEQCLSDTRVENVNLVETDTNGIELTLHGGRIELSADSTAAAVRALIQEINRDMPQ